MNIIRVLWLSRHGMTPEQEESLRECLGGLGTKEYQAGGVKLEVVMENITFPSDGAKAAMLAQKMALANKCMVLTGVFPAHVAGALVHLSRDKTLIYPDGEPLMHRDGYRMDGCSPSCVYVPVAVPAPAKVGEVRGGGFTHHSWACIS